MTQYNNLKLVIKKEVVENRRKSLLVAGGWTALWFIIGGWVGYFGGGGSGTIMFIYFFMAAYMSTILASLAFSDMKTREGRIALLMTPATALDKTLVRMIGVILASIILCAVGYVVFEAGRILTDGIFNNEWTRFYFDLSILFASEDAGWAIALVVGSLLISITFYFLGAIIWPKYSFFKSLLAMWVIQMILGGFLTLFTHFFIGSSFASNINWDIVTYCIVILTYIIAGGLFALAWLRMKRSTILTRLF